MTVAATVFRLGRGVTTISLLAIKFGRGHPCLT